MKDSLDYATLDQGDEKALNLLIQEQLGRSSRQRKRPVSSNPSPVAPSLPMGELAAGQRLAADILAIARQCGQDRACWRQQVPKLKLP